VEAGAHGGTHFEKIEDKVCVSQGSDSSPCKFEKITLLPQVFVVVADPVDTAGCDLVGIDTDDPAKRICFSNMQLAFNRDLAIACVTGEEGEPHNQQWAILPGWIRYHLKPSEKRIFPSSLVAAYSCDSGKNDTMASAFLDRGASYYFGWNDTYLEPMSNYDDAFNQSGGAVVNAFWDELLVERHCTHSAHEQAKKERKNQLASCPENSDEDNCDPKINQPAHFGDELYLTHINNGDFQEGTAGWTVGRDLRWDHRSRNGPPSVAIAVPDQSRNGPLPAVS